MIKAISDQDLLTEYFFSLEISFATMCKIVGEYMLMFLKLLSIFQLSFKTVNKLLFIISTNDTRISKRYS